ncbi:MAG: aspartate dehydrogenase [Thermoproteota archaeon]|jgi:aspartate dehydrogenase|nr:aspartate dehydrogenase [Thermoproteota archaeon]
MPNKSVGLLGCGAIGSHLAAAVDAEQVPNASIVSLFDIVDSKAKSLQSKLRRTPEIYTDFSSFLSSRADIIIEAASQEAVRKYGTTIIEASKELMVMSVGALADTVFLSKLLKVAATKKGQSKIYVPTGAIAGIDALRSVRHITDSVTLTTTKSPSALAGAPFIESRKLILGKIRKRTVIYEGWAGEAVKMFPANVNVAAVLALSGIGIERTKVRIVADPETNTNQHEIVATGSFGDIKITVNNVPVPQHPRTSYLAVLSAIECLRSVCDDSGIRIGS